MGLHRVLEKLTIFAIPSAGVLELVDNPDLGSGGASRGGSSPPTRTKPCPAPMAGRFRTRAGGLRLFTVTPSLNPSPRGRDSAAEAAVRLQAQSLRSEGASGQGLCGAWAGFPGCLGLAIGFASEVWNLDVRKYLYITLL